MNYRKTLVVTVASDGVEDSEGFKWMKETAALHGIEVMSIGGLWQNYYFNKIQQLWEHTRELVQYDYILFLDATDSLFATDLGEIHHFFELVGAPFLMSAEKLCWPWWERHDGFGHSRYPNKPFRHLNSGGYMATWDAYRQVMPRVIDLECGYHERGCTVKNDDQAAFSYGYLEANLPITLDVDSRIFQTMSAVDGRWVLSDEFTWGRRPYNRVTGSCPCIFHANGGEKWRLPDLFSMLTR